MKPPRSPDPTEDGICGMVFVESRANCRESRRGFRASLVLNAEPSCASVHVNFDNRVVIFGRSVGSKKISRRDFEFSLPRTKPPRSSKRQSDIDPFNRVRNLRRAKNLLGTETRYCPHDSKHSMPCWVIPSTDLPKYLCPFRQVTRQRRKQTIATHIS
jgi:hypothetical protein